ncbi:MAG: proteasome subunit alpha, partial [archaeon]
TQSGGLRPFGVALLIAGIDEDGKKLFETDPTGLFYQYKASVIGEGETEIEQILHKEYKETLTIEEGLKVAVKALKKVLDSKFNADRIDAAFIADNKRVMQKVPRDKIVRLLK